MALMNPTAAAAGNRASKGLPPVALEYSTEMMSRMTQAYTKPCQALRSAVVIFMCPSYHARRSCGVSRYGLGLTGGVPA